MIFLPTYSDKHIMYYPRKFIVLNMKFSDGGIGWSQFILPDEKKSYRKELKWLKFENKKKESIEWSPEEFTKDEVVFLYNGDWQPKKWRTSNSASYMAEECIKIIVET